MKVLLIWTTQRFFFIFLHSYEVSVNLTPSTLENFVFAQFCAGSDRTLSFFLHPAFQTKMVSPGLQVKAILGPLDPFYSRFDPERKT